MKDPEKGSSLSGAFLALALVGVISLVGLFTTTLLSQKQILGRLDDTAASLARTESMVESVGREVQALERDARDTDSKLDRALSEMEASNSSLKDLLRSSEQATARMDALQQSMEAQASALGNSLQPRDVPRTVLETYGYEPGVLVAFKGKLIYSDKSGVYVTSDGTAWTREISDFTSLWTYQIYPQGPQGLLYLGGSLLSSVPGVYWEVIYRYDGKKFELVKADRGPGYYASLAIYGGKLWAGGRNRIIASSDGVSWTESFAFDTNRNIFGLAPLEGKLYAFEGEPLREQSRIYVFDGANWAVQGTYDIKGFRTPVGNDRAVSRGLYYTSDYNNRLYAFDGEALKVAFERRREDEAITSRSHWRPKLIQGSLFLAGDSGTVVQGYGELWKSDRAVWRKVLETPYAIMDVEFFRDSLYVAGFTTSDQSYPTYRPGDPVPDYNLNRCFVVRLPSDILNNDLSGTYTQEAVLLPVLPGSTISSLAQSSLVGVEGVARVGVTLEATYAHGVASSLKLHVLSSSQQEDSAFDTSDVYTLELPPGQGGRQQRTWVIEPGARYVKFLVENPDARPVAGVKVTVNVFR